MRGSKPSQRSRYPPPRHRSGRAHHLAQVTHHFALVTPHIASVVASAVSTGIPLSTIARIALIAAHVDTYQQKRQPFLSFDVSRKRLIQSVDNLFGLGGVSGSVLELPTRDAVRVGRVEHGGEWGARLGRRTHSKKLIWQTHSFSKPRP